MDREAKKIRWSPSHSSSVRLNTYWASKNGMITSCGGLVRGCTGDWIGGFAGYLGSYNAYIAELWDVLEGLRLEKDIGF